MALSVSANSGGNGLANLFRQARQMKSTDDAATVADQPTTTVSLRPAGRSGIDSTGSGTAQMSAALTQYLSNSAGSADAAAPAPSAAKSTTPLAAAQSRSSAADLLRVLDAYDSGDLRLSA